MTFVANRFVLPGPLSPSIWRKRCQANAIVDPLPNVKLTPLVFGSVRWPLGFQGRCAMQPKPGLALLPEPIALALDHEGVAVMQESIEDGGGDDVVAEDLTPLRHALIRRDQHRRFLVAMRSEERRVGKECRERRARAH